MRDRLTAVAAGVVVFLAACGGGQTTGTTSGTGTSGGAGATSGGTSTGAPLLDGEPCSANSECANQICGIDGTGNCCHSQCAHSEATCGATACDSSGACVYPPTSTACEGAACTSAKIAQHSCDGAGACVAGTATPCPTHLGCNAAGTACNTSCTSSSDCAALYVCNGGTCAAPLVVGACTENDDCFSGRCGIAGTGHCCVGTSACLTSDATCGATDCELTSGACNYADAGVACGSVKAGCTGSTQQNPTVCDGKGTCPATNTVDCTPFICGPKACLTSCTDNTSCGSGDFCDTLHASCCPALPAGGSLNVDATGGNDAAGCCGLAGYPPCQTLTQAMKIIDIAQAPNVTINAAVRMNGSTWAPPAEVYPIVLGWGVKLSAPGVYFYDGASPANAEIFDIAAVSVNDTVGYASIVGTAAQPVIIGVDEFRDQATDTSVIQVATGHTLYIANAVLNGNNSKDTTAITVAGGGGLILGEDQASAVTGTVTIGNAYNSSTTNGGKGIVCLPGNGPGTGCKIRDVKLKGGKSSLVIEGQGYGDIDAEDYADIVLSSYPVIGLPPADAGFQQCVLANGTGTSTAKPDLQNNSSGAAVLLNGSASVTFNNGTVQCISGDAFLLNTSPKGNGNPTLNLLNSTVQNTEFGVLANAGTATISNSNIQYNYKGVEQGTDGTNVSSIDLSSGGDGGSTAVVCSNSYESTRGRSSSGASVINDTATSLNAQNVVWDTATPDLFSCTTTTFATCTCESSTCAANVDDAGYDGLDAVYVSTGSVDTSGNQITTLDCTAPARGGGGGQCMIVCPPPTQCCGPNICCG